MATTGRPKRVERIADWENARLSIMPARAVRDTRLTLTHLRVIALLGTTNANGGWTELSQTRAAADWGVTRQTVNEAVRDLVAWGYVEKRGQATTGLAVCHYRVLLDREESDEGQPEGDVSGTADTSTCRAEPTRVSGGADGGVGIDGTLPRSQIIDPPPLPPARRGARARMMPLSALIDAARTDLNGTVCDALGRIVAAGLRLDVGDAEPGDVVAALANDADLARLDAPGLDGMVDALINGAAGIAARTRRVFPADIRHAARTQLPAAEQRQRQRDAVLRQANICPPDIATLFSRAVDSVRQAHAINGMAVPPWIAELVCGGVDQHGVATIEAPTAMAARAVEQDQAGFWLADAVCRVLSTRSIRCVVRSGGAAPTPAGQVLQ